MDPANNQLIEETFQDFNLLKTFKSNEKIKKKILRELLEVLPEPWKIIGITPKAFNILKSNGYKLKDNHSRRNLPIQRAHLFDRDVWYTELLQRDWASAEDWYNFIIDKDITVLALSSENSKVRSLEYIKFSNNTNLFRSKRISWHHSFKEEVYLKSLEKLLE